MSTFSYPQLELVYFDFPGKGEAARLLCHCAGIPLKDTRLARDEFTTMKEAGKLQMGQVPALFVNGQDTQIVQSNAIICYLGKLSGLYPTDDHLLAARVDMLLCGEADMFTGLSVATYRERFGFGSLDETAVGAMRAVVASETLPKHLGHLEAILLSYGDAHSSGWLANTPSPSVVDFVYAPRLTWLQSGLPDIPVAILAPFPRIQAYLRKFYAQSKVVEYYEA